MSYARMEHDQIPEFELRDLNWNELQGVQDFVDYWGLDQEDWMVLYRMMESPERFVDGYFWGSEQPRWGSLSPIDMVRVAAELALEIQDADQAEEDNIDDRGPEDFGFEDMGARPFQRITLRRRRIKAMGDNVAACDRSARGAFYRNRSWSRQTKNQHQWEARAKRESKRFMPVPPPEAAEPIGRCWWDMSVHAQQLWRRAEKTRERIEREIRLEREYQATLEREARFLSWGEPPVMHGLTPAEAEQYETEYQDDRGYLWDRKDQRAFEGSDYLRRVHGIDDPYWDEIYAPAPESYRDDFDDWSDAPYWDDPYYDEDFDYPYTDSRDEVEDSDVDECGCRVGYCCPDCVRADAYERSLEADLETEAAYERQRQAELDVAIDDRSPEDFGLPAYEPRPDLPRDTTYRQPAKKGWKGPQWMRHKPRHCDRVRD